MSKTSDSKFDAIRGLSSNMTAPEYLQMYVVRFRLTCPEKELRGLQLKAVYLEPIYTYRIYTVVHISRGGKYPLSRK